jgi:hypothetical protein
LADQLFDRRDRLGIRRCRKGNSNSAAAGTAGAADAVHIVVRVMRHVEIVDVADVGNIEAAGRHIRCDQERHFVAPEPLERGHARGLIHITM